MIRKIISLLLLMGFQLHFSQDTLKSVNNKVIFQEIYKKPFEKAGKQYKLKDYRQVITKEEALAYVRRARTNKTIGEVFAFSGGFCMGYGLFQALAGSKYPGDNNKSRGWTMVGIGAGIVGIGLPFALSVNKNLIKAVDIENGTPPHTGQLNMNIGTNGIGLSYNF
ncbi:hypothetical protein HX13_15335 [Chryseobacterium sp. P1-3]|uniref:hypothetical protein n=1 Tax=Chryseobacterium sp. (strain P1-3) TaxID=1517683 RepID=UPI0004E6F83C|nr:hypothetical protein [Chryseobacterium sp. P1-3]KFF73925.1 hypothetical protein HX13_15335 [Chryseobacterium sp. P1-3]